MEKIKLAQKRKGIKEGIEPPWKEPRKLKELERKNWKNRANLEPREKKGRIGSLGPNKALGEP